MSVYRTLPEVEHTCNKVIPASSQEYPETDQCPLCLTALTQDNPLRSHKVGVIVIHSGPNGFKHPMHEACLKRTTRAGIRQLFDPNKTITVDIRNCPVCKERIFWRLKEKSKYPLTDKVVTVITLMVIKGAAHAALSYLTGRPLLVAITPGILYSFMAIDALWSEFKELELEHPLGTEIKFKLATSAAVIGIPLLASMTASQISESIIPNSLITAMLATGGLIPFKLTLVEEHLRS